EGCRSQRECSEPRRRNGCHLFRREGVSWSAPREKWAAVVTIKGARHTLGHFRDLSDAEYAAVTARARLHEVHSRADLAYLAERGLSVEELKRMEESHNG